MKYQNLMSVLPAGFKCHIYLIIVLLLFLNVKITPAQKIFIDSLIDADNYLSTFHFNFNEKRIYYPTDRFNIIIQKNEHDPRYLLPLPNAPTYLDIPTDDSSRQCVHPSVIDFLNEYNIREWNGYRYWMAMTPYPNTNAKKENPNIVASHDGLKWEVPKGIINPIDKIENDTLKENLADPDIIYNPETDQIWLYYMHRIKSKNVLATFNLIKINKDLSHTKPVEIIFFPGNDSLTVVSPCFWRESPVRWHMWGIRLRSPNQMVYMFSKDGMKWSEQKLCVTKEGNNPFYQIGYRPWHISCKPNYREKRIEFMANCARGGQWETFLANKTNCLIYAEANMKKPTLIATPINVPILFCSSEIHSWDYPIIYRSSFTINYQSGKYFYRIWYSAASYNNGTWHIGYTEGGVQTYYSDLTLSAPVTYNDDIIIDSTYHTIRIYYYGPAGDTIHLSLENRSGHIVFSENIASKITDFNISLLLSGEYLAIISSKNYKLYRILKKK